MNPKTVRRCLHSLVKLGIITAERTNRATIYRRATADNIGHMHSHPQGEQAAIAAGTPTGREGGTPTGREGQHSHREGGKSNPIEGSPFKENVNGAAVATPAPPKPLYLQLNRHQRAVCDRLARCLPDWKRNEEWWGRLLRADADLLDECVRECLRAATNGEEIQNRGGWITEAWKLKGGNAKPGI